MAEVERLLVASTVQVTAYDPRHPDARSCLRAYFSDLARRFDHGFDPARSNSAENQELTPPAGLLLVATLHFEPVGCGALKLHHDARRDQTDAGRPRGLRARARPPDPHRPGGARGSQPSPAPSGWKPTPLHEAIGLYRAVGYREAAAFNDEPYAHHWFEKTLDRSSPRRPTRPDRQR